MARPKIYVRPKPNKNGEHQLLLSYFFNGSRLEYYTGISIKKADYIENYFKGNKNPIKQTAAYAPHYNSRLKNIEADAVKIVTDTKGDNLNARFVREQLDLIYKPKQAELETIEGVTETSFIKFFEQAITDSKSGKRLISSTGQRYSISMIKHYGVTLSAIKRYLKFIEQNDLSILNVDVNFYESFRTFCFNEEEKEKATFGGYIRDIKTLMNESGNNKQVEAFKKPSYEADTIYLTTEEIQKIADLDLSDGTKFYRNKNNQNIYYHTLDKVRDLYLIGAYTGLRFSDFSKLDIKSVEKNFIKLKQQKTGNRVVIPIMSKLKPVLSKYPDSIPTISNQKFNDYIKHIAELAGLVELRTMTNTKGNKLNTYKAKLYTLITSHSCRRSYATNMFKAGIRPMLIMSATGHKTETSFLKYIRASSEDKANLLAEALEKLGL
ncbi:site-specific integrase [Pedobacter frigiditerrae]|uniref:site-specific integrase n=1 Tax=Pedobacter frigiditerrae TaxID=2530452 RepID=UPI00292CC805|nr:site-specific integrase [Pedobacter frigiditerrae]